MDSIFSGIQSARQHVQDGKSRLSAALAAYTASVANDTGGNQDSDMGNGDYGGDQGGPTTNDSITQEAYNNQDAYENAAYGNGDNSNSNQGTLTSNNFVSESANSNQDAYENAGYGGNNGITGTSGTNAGTSHDSSEIDTDNDAGNGAYSDPQGGELYPSNSGVVGESYSGEQGGTPGSVPDNATGGPNSLTTGQTTNPNPESVIGLDSNTMDGLNNTDSNDAGTMSTDEHTVGLGFDATIVSVSGGMTTGSAEQVTHNADGTTSVASQDIIDTGVNVGAGIGVVNGELGGSDTNIHSVENSGETETVQDSINENGGLVDTSDISAIPEGITVTEIGEPGYDFFDSGETGSGSLSQGVSIGGNIGGAEVEFSSESTGTISNMEVDDLDTTVATNNGETTTVATGETDISETTYSVENSDGLSVGDTGPAVSTTVAATNTSQTTETEGMDYPNTAAGQNAAQTHADTGDLTLDDSGQYDVTNQTTETHVETIAQDGMTFNSPGSSFGDGEPEVLNTEVEQTTSVDHMQGDPNGSPDDGIFGYGGDEVLGTSTSHSISESPQNGEDGFTVTETSDFQGQGLPNVEQVQVDTTGGVSYNMTPEEMQNHAQNAANDNPDNDILQDIAGGDSAPEAISAAGTINPITGNDNAPSIEALEAIGQEHDPYGLAHEDFGMSTTDSDSIDNFGGEGTGTGSVTNSSVTESANNNQDSYENEAYGNTDSNSDSSTNNSGSTTSSSVTESANSNQDSYENEAYGGSDSSSDSDSDSGSDSGSTTSSSVTESANSNQDSYENEAYGNTDTNNTTTATSDSDSVTESANNNQDSYENEAYGNTDTNNTTTSDSDSVTESANNNQDSYENEAYGNTDTTTTTTTTSDSDSDDDDDDGGCFLTTSACEHRGLSDDCHELTVLRGFRDTWMHATPELQEQVREYYRVAPAVVESIQAMPDRTVILESMFTEYIRPSVEAIERGENDMAYEIYVKMLCNVQELAAVNMSPTALSVEA